MTGYIGYKDALSYRNKSLRALWNICCLLLFKPFPGPIFRRWRIFVLKIFGAKIGVHCAVASSVRIWAPWNLHLGDYVALGPRCECYNVDEIIIGSVVTISQDSYLCTASHDISKLETPLIKARVLVSDNVWVASHAIVLQGVTIGEGAIVGAGAVVTKDVAPWIVVGGNPAVKIKTRGLDHD